MPERAWASMMDIVTREATPGNPKAAEKLFDDLKAATPAVDSRWLRTTQCDQPANLPLFPSSGCIVADSVENHPL